jgi:hypothetical protein
MKAKMQRIWVTIKQVLASRWFRLPTTLILMIGMIGAVAVPVASHFSQPLIVVHHSPDAYARRAGYFTANITGKLRNSVELLEWKINDHPWKLVGHSKRNPRPAFTIEIPVELLTPGLNEVQLKASAPFRKRELKRVSFSYDPTAIELPTRVFWTPGARLDVQDGHWEILPEGRVRPVPGHEGFDRNLIVSGAIEGGRRVETELIFRGRAENGRYGFGIFPLWGGQPDDPDVSPRRGYRFSLLWYSNGTWGYGCEFSQKIGANAPEWVSKYRSIEIKQDVPYRLVTETWPEQTSDGRHLRWRQRCKWWPSEEAEPAQWLTISDDLGAPLPAVAYAVAIFAHHSQVEFGPVVVEALPTIVVESDEMQTD